MQYYIMSDGLQIGPMTIDQMFAYNVTEQTPVRKNDNEEWRPLFTFPELMAAIKNHNSDKGTCVTSDKDKTTAGILALLIGTLGIHYFYIGKTTAGLLTILISLVTCGAWGIITFIQGILMLTMSQQDFERKYVYSTSKFPLF